jgi:opacity protein-like surface antigen
MKYLCVMMALVMMLSGGALAEAKRPIYMLSGGVALPSQPESLNESWNSGWHIGGGIGYPLTRCLTVGGTISYSHLPFDAEAAVKRDGARVPFLTAEGVSSTILAGGFRAKLNLVAPTVYSRVSPYFFGALTWMRVTQGEYVERFRNVSKWSEQEYRHSTRITRQSGMEIGAGMELCLSHHLNVCAELAYSSSYTASPIFAEWVPVRIGLLLH